VNVMNIIIDFLEKVSQMISSWNNGWKYSCMEEFVLKNGKTFKVGNGKVKRGKVKECFKNAFHLADSGSGLVYVEGYATSKGLPFPVLHAWCVDSKGNILDPTWKDGEEYYGVPFDMGFVCRTILKRKKFGVIDNCEDGFPLLSGQHIDFLYKGEMK